jgi:hypothetical protein
METEHGMNLKRDRDYYLTGKIEDLILDVAS